MTCMALVLASGPQTITCNKTVYVVVSVMSSPKMFSSSVFFHENIKHCESVWFISVWGAKLDFTMVSCCHVRGHGRGWHGRCEAWQDRPHLTVCVCVSIWIRYHPDREHQCAGLLVCVHGSDDNIVVVVSFVIDTDPTLFHLLSHFQTTQLQNKGEPWCHFALTDRGHVNRVCENARWHNFVDVFL